MIIAIDFDGTCVTHAYPEIGKDIGAVPILKELVEKGHKLILYTMRHGESLDAAVQWFKDNDIELYAANKNPTQELWSLSPKIFAQLYIDDAALGCPLRTSNKSERPYVNWTAVARRLNQMKLISDKHTDWFYVGKLPDSTEEEGGML